MFPSRYAVVAAVLATLVLSPQPASAGACHWPFPLLDKPVAASEQEVLKAKDGQLCGQQKRVNLVPEAELGEFVPIHDQGYKYAFWHRMFFGTAE